MCQGFSHFILAKLSKSSIRINSIIGMTNLDFRNWNIPLVKVYTFLKKTDQFNPQKDLPNDSNFLKSQIGIKRVSKDFKKIFLFLSFSYYYLMVFKFNKILSLCYDVSKIVKIGLIGSPHPHLSGVINRYWNHFHDIQY